MLRLAVRVARSQAELVLAELLELAPSGVEEVALGDELVEFAVYGAPGELPSLPDLRAAAGGVGGVLIDVSTSEIADDWSERWRAFHRPLVLAGRLTVRPPWEPPGDTPLDLVIEPGQAFGTGAHATTRMCLELLLAESAPASGSFVDLGCGSGVLAIAAARLGYAPVCALDNDPAAVAATAENARVNGVEVDVRRFDLREEPVPRGEVVAANLLGPLLVRHAAAIGAHARRVIASGLLATERNRVAEAFAAGGYHVADERRGAEWAALVLARNTAAVAG